MQLSVGVQPSVGVQLGPRSPGPGCSQVRSALQLPIVACRGVATVQPRLVKEPNRTDEIKRLVRAGKYRIDPVAVADAMIRRGWALEVSEARERGSKSPNHLAGGNGAT